MVFSAKMVYHLTLALSSAGRNIGYCERSGSHSGDYEDDSLLGYCTV
jgi:hypothetical protein